MGRAEAAAPRELRVEDATLLSELQDARSPSDDDVSDVDDDVHDDDTVDSLLAEIARVTSSARAVPRVRTGTIIADRYRLVAQIGRGAHGVVWKARDRIARSLVAIKLFLADGREHAVRARAEIASLRRLRVPGVAHLLDEGAEPELSFLVMPLVSGAPFPGRRVPLPWKGLAPRADRLLEVLERVHAVGVVHRDLKPANVLVDREGRPTLLDFGLATLSTLDGSARAKVLAGTPAYLAPEQLADDGVDERADLYAVGVLLFHSLSGGYPHEAPDVRQLLAAKSGPPRSLRRIAPKVPKHVANVVDKLLATRPQDRFGSAREVIDALGDSHKPTSTFALPARPSPGAPLRVEELACLFAGDERLSCVRSDAAQRLFEAAKGSFPNVPSVVEAWLRQGRCRRTDDGRLLFDRPSLDQLEASLWASLPHDDDLRLVEQALQKAGELVREGRLGNAVAALQEALAAARRIHSSAPALEKDVLAIWCEVAIADGSAPALDHVLYEMSRASAPGAVAPLAQLVRAALATFSWSVRASLLADAVPPFFEAGLECCRLNVRVLAARRNEVALEARVVAEAISASSPFSDARLRAASAGWLGRLAYREGRYSDAARHQIEAASHATARGERVSAILHAASATLEAFDNERALTLAAAARNEARESRNVRLIGRAEWLVRCAEYRIGTNHQVDDELLEAARGVGHPTFGLIGLAEAAHAYRSRDPRAGTLAAEVHRAWAETGEPIASLIAGALSVAGGITMPKDARARLRAASWKSRVPGVGIQTAALLHLGGEVAPPTDVVRMQASTVEKRWWGKRMDVLSIDEALRILGMSDLAM